MGRRKLYISDEEKKQANREKAMKFYWKNKEECDKRARDRYWERKLSYKKSEEQKDEKLQEPQEIINEEHQQ